MQCSYIIIHIATWRSYPLCFLVLDPALIGLSLAYGVSLSNIVQYSVRLSGEIENLVSHIATCTYMCCYCIVIFYNIIAK